MVVVVGKPSYHAARYDFRVPRCEDERVGVWRSLKDAKFASVTLAGSCHALLLLLWRSVFLTHLGISLIFLCSVYG